MTNGKHAATEVPAALTLDDCWTLVETAEKTGKYCVMWRIAVRPGGDDDLDMVAQGLLGTLLHGEGGYLHDRRKSMFSNAGNAGVANGLCRKGQWATSIHAWAGSDRAVHEHQSRQPACPSGLDGQPSLCLNEFADKAFGPDSPQAKRHFVLSDWSARSFRRRPDRPSNSRMIPIRPPVQPEDSAPGTKGTVRKYPEEKI